MKQFMNLKKIFPILIILTILILAGCSETTFIDDGKHYVGYVYDEGSQSCVKQETDNIYDPYEHHTLEECEDAKELEKSIMTIIAGNYKHKTTHTAGKLVDENLNHWMSFTEDGKWTENTTFKEYPYRVVSDNGTYTINDTTIKKHKSRSSYVMKQPYVLEGTTLTISVGNTDVIYEKQ